MKKTLIFIIVAILSSLAPAAKSERNIVGLDVGLGAKWLAGPFMPLGGEISIDVRPWKLFHLSASLVLGVHPDPDLNLLSPGKSFAISGDTYFRFNLYTDEVLIGGYNNLGYREQAPKMLALSLELGGFWGALPFYLKDQSTEFRYIYYPSLGLRWDTYDEFERWRIDRFSLGVRGYYGPLGSSESEHVDTWSYSEKEPGKRSLGVAVYIEAIHFDYFATGLEGGGGAGVSWMSLWMGVNLPIL